METWGNVLGKSDWRLALPVRAPRMWYRYPRNKCVILTAE